MKLICILALCFTSLFAKPKKPNFEGDGYGPIPLTYRGDYFQFVAGEKYTLQGLIVPADETIPYILSKNGKTKWGFQVDLRVHPILGKKSIRTLNNSPIFPLVIENTDVLEPFLYAKIKVKAFMDLVSCQDDCDGLLEFYKPRFILDGVILESSNSCKDPNIFDQIDI